MFKKNRAHLRIALVGASGRMGLEIEKLSRLYDCEIAAHVNSGKEWKTIRSQDIDVIVDFSSPAGMAEALTWACTNKRPIVSGTTGLNAQQHKKLRAAAKKIPVLYSGNMSLGIATFAAMLKAFSAIQDWEFQIEEVHHSMKKDRPSGTALLLQERLKEVLGRNPPPPQSIRGGGVPGIHTLWAMGPEETLVIQHTAFNRQVFARGALRAAFWLFDKNKAGLYDLSDLYKT